MNFVFTIARQTKNKAVDISVQNKEIRCSTKMNKIKKAVKVLHNSTIYNNTKTL